CATSSGAGRATIFRPAWACRNTRKPVPNWRVCWPIWANTSKAPSTIKKVCCSLPRSCPTCPNPGEKWHRRRTGTSGLEVFMLLLTALATLLIVYVIYAVTIGQVYGRGLVEKEDSPQAFWTLTLIYAAVGLILLALA